MIGVTMSGAVGATAQRQGLSQIAQITTMEELVNQACCLNMQQ